VNLIVKRIQDALKTCDFDAVMLNSPQNRLYATGFESSSGMVVITRSNAYFATDFCYYEDAAKKVSGFTLKLSRAGYSYFDFINEVIKTEQITRLGFEDGGMYHASFLNAKEMLCAELVPIGDLMTKLRRTKLPHELQKLEQAQRIAEESFQALLPEIRPGVTEMELASKLNYYMALRGSSRPSFDTIVVSGENGSLCHGKPSKKTIEKGEFITFDFGATFEGYCSDMTRTVAVGTPNEEMAKVYHIVLEAQLAAIAAAKAGILGCDLDSVARDLITDAGYGEYFGHTLGHSVGLDVHDGGGSASQFYKAPLCENFVCTIEPGIYLPGKFGVRIEDFIVLKSDGCINLTKFPKELLIL